MSAERSTPDVPVSPQESAHESTTPETSYVVRLWLNGVYLGGLYQVYCWNETASSLETNPSGPGSQSIIHKYQGFTWIIEEFR